MKAMILAAGFGTRLLPYTEITPKPLFSIGGRPLLDIHIDRLQHSGCEAVIINTHHLHHKIRSFLSAQNYLIPVEISHETEILGTGGAIRNVTHFWDETPFMVINSDIVTDIDLAAVYRFHLNHDHPVTLVLHDYPEFNHVTVDDDDCVMDFNDRKTDPRWRKLAFTGIQVLDARVLAHIPPQGFASSIEVYRRLITGGEKIKSYISNGHYWRDIGTPESYRKAVFEKMAPEAFRKAWPGSLQPKSSNGRIKQTILQGDGSDRQWYRLSAGNRSLILADHGIRRQPEICEADSFVAIGRHLRGKDIPVPTIYGHDACAGLVFLEDLGDENLQRLVQGTARVEKTIAYYQEVIDHLVAMSVDGARGFDAAWTYQSAHYDKALILEKECRYFTDAFLGGYLQAERAYEEFESEFNTLTDRILETALTGFMHRDLQSRNIMVKDHRFYFIDFQGGRFGPVQYDLASLLIDPYVQLALPVREQLVDYGAEKLSSVSRINRRAFRTGYDYCALARNLQMLGAFGYLSRNKQKTYFERYIPAAWNSLKHHLFVLGKKEFPKLTSMAETLSIKGCGSRQRGGFFSPTAGGTAQ